MNSPRLRALHAWLQHETLAKQALSLQGEVVVGEYFGCRLTSAFQPLRRLEDKTVVAWEAYARSWVEDAVELSPWSLFARAAKDADLVSLDRLCRILHAANFFGRPEVEGDLFLNVNERLLPAVADHHGDFFARVLREHGVAAPRVIIDIPPLANEDFLLLALVATNYRRNHFRLALSARNLLSGRRLLSHFEPDFLFVDMRDFPLHHHLAELAEVAAKQACQLIAKRVETPAQVAAAQEAGIPLVQGYAFDVPQALAGQRTELAA